MKKVVLGLAIILSSQTLTAMALPSTCVSVPSLSGGLTFGLTGLYWRPSVSHLEYGLTFPLVQSENGPVVSTVDGTYHNVNPDYDWGFKASIGYIFPCTGNDINLTYTHYDQNERGETLRNPSGFVGGNIDVGNEVHVVIDTPQLSFITAPAIVDNQIRTGTAAPGILQDLLVGSVDLVDAKTNFKNNTWDLDVGQYVNVGCNLRLHWFGGVRYSKLEHSLERVLKVSAESLVQGNVEASLPTAATFTPPLLGQTTGLVILNYHIEADITEITGQNSEFNGIGPRLGLEGRYDLACGFGLVGGASTSILVGQLESQFRELSAVETVASVTNRVNTQIVGTLIVTPGPIFVDILEVEPSSITQTNADEISFHHPDQTQVVPNIDAKLGLDWTYQFCNCSHTKMTLEAGYQVSHYFNAVDRLSLLGAEGPELNTRQTLDLSFDGPYLGVHVAL